MTSKLRMKKWMIFSLGGAAALCAAGLATLNAGKKAEEATPANLLAAIEGKLVRPAEGGEFEDFSIAADKAPKYVAVYYSAHWCGPCRAFTPELVKFYDAAKGKGGDFELIFVSSDTSEKAMHEYMIEAGMKFPALKYSERNTTRALTKHAGPGIPCLVVLDATGNVLANSFEGDRYLGPQVPMLALEKLLERAS